jgi:hypothetical protein
MLRNNTSESELLYKKTKNKKIAIIRKIKRQNFHTNITKIIQITKNIYRITK